MLKCTFYKRGVSPLIATVLLISFAVALGSVLISWGRNFEVSNPGDPCSGVSIKIRGIGSYDACYTGAAQNSYIKFIIDNFGRDIDGIAVWIIGEKGTKLIDEDNTIIKAGQLLEIKDTKISYDFNNYGKIRQIQFIPKIKTKDSIEICSKNSVKTENIGAC